MLDEISRGRVRVVPAGSLGTELPEEVAGLKVEPPEVLLSGLNVVEPPELLSGLNVVEPPEELLSGLKGEESTEELIGLKVVDITEEELLAFKVVEDAEDVPGLKVAVVEEGKMSIAEGNLFASVLDGETEEAAFTVVDECDTATTDTSRPFKAGGGGHVVVDFTGLTVTDMLGFND